jgi:hypothetical protein
MTWNLALMHPRFNAYTWLNHYTIFLIDWFFGQQRRVMGVEGPGTETTQATTTEVLTLRRRARLYMSTLTYLILCILMQRSVS